LAAVTKNATAQARVQAAAAKARERAHRWRRRAATVGAAALAVVIAYGVVFGHNGITVYLHKRQEQKSLQQQMVLLEKENDRLRGHAERLQSDPSAIEHEAREELHYTRAGEVIVTLPVAQQGSAPLPPPASK
jgi:cell division protein FtsB